MFLQLTYKYIEWNKRPKNKKVTERPKMIQRRMTIKLCGSHFCKLLGKLNKNSAHIGGSQENDLMVTPKINAHPLRTITYRQVQSRTRLWIPSSMQIVTETKPTKPHLHSHVFLILTVKHQKLKFIMCPPFAFLNSDTLLNCLMC